MERKSQRSADRLGMKRHWQAGLLASTALSAVLALPMAAQAQSISATATPQGGVVVGGSATITQAPASTTIDQTSQRAAIDFQSFDVGSAAKVQINQPDANSVELDRVVGGNLSQINGQINSNGQVVLINQSGVVFGKGAQINAENVVVSTSNIATSDFMAGHLVFSGAPKPGAQIINDGQITARNAGLVGLVAPQVANNGVITAQLGQVILAGASAFTLDLYGDRLISLDVTKAVQAVDVGGKAVPALVTNSGLILADGGKITLTAQDADALVTQLINAGGTIRANSVGGATGNISIQGVGGNISIAGNLLAQGQNGAQGGKIQALTTGTVAVAGSAVLDASGDSGGGVLALGTNIARAQQGAADAGAPQAASVSVAAGARLNANAGSTGHGGTVTLLSRNKTDFHGAISVTGGSVSGNGGLAEISSGQVISLDGTVFDTAPHGQAGSVVLDPARLVVGTGTPAEPVVSLNGTVIIGNDSLATSYIAPAQLAGLSGTIVLEASTLISVQQAVNIASPTADLTLTSGGNITISAPISVGGSLEVDATNSLSVDGNLTAPGVRLSSGMAGMDIAAGVTAGIVTLVSTGTIFESGGGIFAGTLSGSAVGGFELQASNNTIANLRSIAVSAGDFAIVDTGSLNVVGGVTAQDVYVSAPTLGLKAELAATLGSGATLAVAANSISVAGGSFSVANGSLEIAPLSAGTMIDFGKGSSAGTLGLPGSVVAAFDSSASLIEIGNGAIGSQASAISIDGSVSFASGPLVILSTSGTVADNSGTFSAGGLGINAASVTQSKSAALDVAVLQGGGGPISGNVILPGTANAIATVESLVAGGTLNIADTGTLGVAGFVGAGNISLNVPDIALAAGGTLDADGTAPVLSLAGDTLSAGAGAALLAAGGTVALAPYTSGRAIVLGAASTGTKLGIGADVIGAVGATTSEILVGNATVGNITIANGLASFASPLDLSTGGSIFDLGTLSGGTITFDAANGFTQGVTGAISASLFGSDGVASGGNVLLDGAANTIAALGSFGVGIGNLSVLDNGALTIAGAISVSAATLSADTLVIDNDISVSGLLAFGSTGSISQIGGSITAPTLAGYGSIGGDAKLAVASNNIGTLGAFTLGGALYLADAGLLKVAGPVSGAAISLSAGTINLAGNLTAVGELALGGTGTVTQSAGVISAGTLASLGSIGGDVVLGRGNSIASLGGFTLGGNLTLNDAQALDISGTVATPNAVTLTGTSLGESTGALNIGTLTTGAGSFSNAVSLAGANSIATLGKFTLGNAQILTLNDASVLDITGLVSLPGGSFVATGGGLNETGAGAVTAATFTTGGQTVAGNILLTGANRIGVLDNAAATGTLAVNNTVALGLQDGISAADIFLAAPTLSLSTALASQVIAGGLASPGTLALAANVYGSGAGAASLSAPGGTIELAAYSTGTVIDLGNAGSAGTLGLPASVFANFGTDAARIIIGNGAVGTLASGILIDQSVSFGGTTIVDLATSGSISDKAGTLSAATLAFGATGFTQNVGAAIDTGLFESDGGSVSGSVLLTGTANAIGALGALTLGGSLVVLDTGLLTVAGGLAAPVVSLSSDTIAIAGNISAPTRLALGSSGSISQSAGSISAGTLVSIGTIGGDVTLAGANSIATLGAFTLGGALDLVDAGLLNVAGPVAGNAVSLSAGSIDLTGNVTAGGTLAFGGGAVSQTGGSITAAVLTSLGTIGSATLGGAGNLIGTLGGFAASGNILLGDAASLAIAGIVATPGTLILQGGSAISEIGGGVIDAGSFGSGAGTIGGNVSLANANSIATLGNLVLGNGGTLTLADATALRIAGQVSADTVALTSAGSVVETGSGLIDAGTFGTGGGSIAGDLRLTGANSIASLGMLNAGGTFVLDNNGSLGIDGPVTAGVVSLADNGVITLAGAVSGTLGFVSLLADGLNEANGGTVAAPGGTIAIAPFTAGRGVDLGGTQANALDLSAGVISALDPTAKLLEIGGANTGNILAEGSFAFSNPTLALTASGPVSVTGTLGGNEIILSGNGLSLNGAVGATSLVLASLGTISQNQGGVLTVGTLSGSGLTGGDVSLAGSANAIGTLANFDVNGSFSGLDASALVVAGSLVASNISLTENGAAAANSLAIDGTLLGGSGGMIALRADAMSAAGAAISAPGGTVLLTPYDAGTAIDLGGTNAGLDLSTGLLGAVSSQTGLLKIVTTGSLSADGNVTLNPASVLLSGNGITFNGVLDLPGASTLALASTNGVTTSSGESLTAGLLMGAGTITGPVAMGQGVNDIGTLGAFSLTGAGNDFALSDALALVISSPLDAGNIALSAAGLTIANVVSASSGLTLASSAGILETGAGALDAAVLSGGTAGIGGDVVLTGAGNNIGSLSSMSLSSGALSLTDNGSLNVGGSVVAGSITLVAGTIGLSGGLSVVSALALDALSGGVSQSSGVIIAPTLTSDGATIGGAALLGDAGNVIGTLGGFAASGRILVNDASALAIAGLVSTPGELSLESVGAISELAGGVLGVGTLDSGGTAIGGDVALGNANSIAALSGMTLVAGHTLSLNDATGLSVAGEVVASNVVLNAASIAVPGSLVVAGLLALGAGGGVSESGAGAISAGTLISQGSIGGDVSLGGGNSIGTLGAFTLGGALDIADAGLLLVAGPVRGQAVSLAAGTIDLAGTITAPGDIALGSSGAIFETGGVLRTGSLTSLGSIGGNVTLGGANTIATLGAFTLGGTLGLVDSGLLSVVGPVAGQVVSLTAATIDLAGDITAPGEIALGSTGTIFQSGGVLSSGQLISLGSVGGDVILTGANAVGTLGAFTLGGTLDLVDAGLLIVAGPVSAPVVSLSAGTMDLAGTIIAPGKIALGSTGTIFQSAGVISTSDLVSQNTIGSDVTLADANLVGTLGGFAAGGNIILSDADPLVVTGPVSAANITLNTAGLAVNGQLASAGALAIASSAGVSEGVGGQVDAGVLTTGANTVTGNIVLNNASNSIASLGVLAASGGLTLNDAVALGLTAPVHLGGTLALGDASSITQTGGVISAVALTSDGGTIGGNVVLGQSGNTIPVLGNFATSGDLTLADADALSLAGNVTTGNMLSLETSGALSQGSGIIGTNTLNASATSITLTDANNIGALGTVATAGALVVSGASGLAGPLTAASALITTPGDFALTGNAGIGGGFTLSAGGVISQSGGTVAAQSIKLGATGNIDQTAGSLSAQSVTLSGSNITLGGNVSATDMLAIDPAGGFTQTGGGINAPVVLIAATGDVLQNAGSLNAQTATISGGNIDLAGNTSITNTLDIIATGNITHGSGTLDAGMLEGSAPQFASFGSVTDFGTLGSFIMHDSQFILSNSGPLTITGPVVANSVTINAVGLITLAGSGNGGLFITGSIAPNKQAAPRPGDSVITSTGGANGGAGIVQTGNFAVNSGQLANTYLGTQNQAATLFLSTVQSGPITFAAYPNALQAPTVDLVIAAGQGGVVTGNIHVAHIEILSAASTNLTGTINNIAGASAAAGGSVDPFPQPNFRFNTCPIGSVNCTILPIESIPEGNPLDNFDLKKRKRKKLDHNIELPGIATRDY